MNGLLIRLAASGLMTVALGAGVALADGGGSGGASIELTGPGSTNIISGGSSHNFRSNISNRVYGCNCNNQYSRSGDERFNHNTKVYGDGYGSGSARNYNDSANNVYLSNRSEGNNGYGSWGNGGSRTGAIALTGPYSYNRISDSGNRSSFNSQVRNNVNTSNFNSQQATTGNVRITGNTVVEGVGGSGNASNFNSAENNVAISNSQPHTFFGNWGPTGAAEITTTGPDSFNSISGGGRSSRVNLLTNNNVNASNANYQSARSGDVTISHNTVVSGVGGSGDATNWNSASNGVDVSNN
jgi:hypothetical protein